MMTLAVRERSGTKVMPVTGNTHGRRFSPYMNSLAGLGVALLTRPGPGGVGTEIVDPNGTTVYSAAEVAANPSLLSSLPSPCPSGMLPTWFPGGESICADNNTRTSEGTVAFGQFNYPVMGSCPVDGWCFTGSDPSNPASYVWQGAGSPTSLNPAIIRSANPLPSVFVTPTSAADTLRIQDAQNNPGAIAQFLSTPVGTAKPPTTVTTNPGVSNALNPPTGNSPVTSGAIANSQNQSGNANTAIGAGNQSSVTDLVNQAESATGLSGSTLLLLAAAAVGAYFMFKK